VARITVRLTPRAGRDAIQGWDGDELRVRVARPPVDGRANAALIKLLAKALGVAPSRCEIVSGATARTKVIEIEGISLDEAKAALGA
jgi:uncharacterized protein